MLELYDNQMSTSAQKVRLVMAEKGLEYVSHNLNLQAGDQFKANYLKLSPEGEVPCLVHDGEVYLESTVICEYLDDAFPDPPLKPRTASALARMREWTVQTDRWMLVAINNLNIGLVFRVIHRQKTPEEMEAFFGIVPDTLKRQRQRSLVEEGVGSPLVAYALRRYARLIREIDGSLEEGGPWLAGAGFSLADTGLFPYLNRLSDLGFDALWRDRPRYQDWFERVKARASVDKAIDQVVPPPAIEFARRCVAEVRPEIDAILETL